MPAVKIRRWTNITVTKTVTDTLKNVLNPDVSSQMPKRKKQPSAPDGAPLLSLMSMSVPPSRLLADHQKQQKTINIGRNFYIPAGM